MVLNNRRAVNQECSECCSIYYILHSYSVSDDTLFVTANPTFQNWVGDATLKSLSEGSRVRDLVTPERR